MPESLFLRNEILRAHLKRLLSAGQTPARQEPRQQQRWGTALESLRRGSTEPLDVVVTLNEINDQHGTGPLLKRILKGRRNVVSVRSRDHWGGHDFGDWSLKISQEGRTRPECFRSVLQVLGGNQVRSVLCVPFLPDEVMTAVAISEAFGARLCAYVMDDQNVAAQGIPDLIMKEFLEKSCLRLATHHELRLAYEQKYGLPFHILPAVVPAHLIPTEPMEPRETFPPMRGALLGSFWDQSWFDRLCSALEDSRYAIDWYGNARSPWLNFPRERLARAGITPHGVIPEERLATVLRQYPFVIVPGGALDEREQCTGVASLSLPGRILFAAATSNTPILLVGSRHTCGARFVSHFGLGETVPYDAQALNKAMDRISQQGPQDELRRNAAGMARLFSDEGVPEWLIVSIERGHPADTRFEDAFAAYPNPSAAAEY